MKIFKNKLLFLIVLFLSFNFLFAKQEIKQETKTGQSDSTNIIEKKVPDTLCFRYKFYKGDYLTYIVRTSDSMIHNMDKPILKSRTDELQISCDSVDASGNFYLEIQTLKSIQKEWTNSKDTVVRSSMPWIGKRAMIVIDSIGNRKSAKLLDSNYIVASPGGAFQPYLFFSLTDQCIESGKTWLTKSVDTLYENSYPPALLEQTSLFRAKERIMNEEDTLVSLSYVRTGKGYYRINSDEIKINIQDVLNTYGEMSISSTGKIPVRFTVTQEEKMHLFLDDGSQIPSWHFTNITFELKSIIRKAENIRDDIQKLRNELKKNSKNKK